MDQMTTDLSKHLSDTERNTKARMIANIQCEIECIRRDKTEIYAQTTLSTLRRACFLTLSPLGIPLMPIICAVGLTIGCFSPHNKAWDDIVPYAYRYERHQFKLYLVTEELLGEGNEIISPKEIREHALIHKASTITLFAGCIGNAVLSSRRHYAYAAKARMPFFLLGALGLALAQYTATYHVRWNQALIVEAERMIEKLNE